MVGAPGSGYRGCMTHDLDARPSCNVVPGERFAQALQFAAVTHRSQMRKGSGIPYIGHLLGVCSLVIEDGGDEDEAIARCCTRIGAFAGAAASPLGRISRSSRARAKCRAPRCTPARMPPSPPPGMRARWRARAPNRHRPRAPTRCRRGRRPRRRRSAARPERPCPGSARAPPARPPLSGREGPSDGSGKKRCNDWYSSPARLPTPICIGPDAPAKFATPGPVAPG